MSRDSGEPESERLERLRELYPEVFAEGRVDLAKLATVLGDDADERPECCSFSWAGKRDAIRLLQVPSRAALVPARDESVEFDATQHVFIEGENLETLKLLRRAYAGRVKMIYIDPPYNTCNDFIYPDDFSDPLGRYLELSGQADAAGNLLTSNPETSGRYHSSWLSMMYPRLFLARQLLRDDGVIFVSIDDHEVHNLRLLMNEIFGEENFVAAFVWKRKAGGADDSGHVAAEHEYVLCFSRDSSKASVASVLRESPSMTAKYNRKENERRYYLERLDKTSLTYSPSMDFPIRCPDGTVIRPPQPDPANPTTSWRWGKATVEKRRDELTFLRENGSGEWRIYTRTWEPSGG